MAWSKVNKNSFIHLTFQILFQLFFRVFLMFIKFFFSKFQLCYAMRRQNNNSFMRFGTDKTKDFYVFQSIIFFSTFADKYFFHASKRNESCTIFIFWKFFINLNIFFIVYNAINRKIICWCWEEKTKDA